MKLRNVEGFEVVVGRFDFRAFHDGKADGEENVFDLLQDLVNQVVRTDRAENAGQREINALASAGGLAGTGFDGFAAFFDFGFYVGAELIQFLADDPLEFLRGRLEPVVGDLGQHAGLAAEPGVAELFPGRFVASARALFVKAPTKAGEEGCELLWASDAEVDEGQPRFVFRRAHDHRPSRDVDAAMPGPTPFSSAVERRPWPSPPVARKRGRPE